MSHYTTFGNEGIFVWAGVFLGLSYIIAVIEGCCSNTSSFVGHVTSATDFLQQHEELQQAVPSITLTAEAYHSEVSILCWGRDINSEKLGGAFRVGPLLI